jgi:hypothetical protein
MTRDEGGQRSRRGPADRLHRLREDVVGELVAGYRDARVAHRVEGVQGVGSDDLRGHANVGIAVPHQLSPRIARDRVHVIAGGDVEPLDDDRAVESLRTLRVANDHARRVRSRHGARLLAARSDGSRTEVIRPRRAGEQVLLLAVAIGAEVHRRGVEREPAQAPRYWPGDSGGRYRRPASGGRSRNGDRRSHRDGEEDRQRLESGATGHPSPGGGGHPEPSGLVPGVIQKIASIWWMRPTSTLKRSARCTVVVCGAVGWPGAVVSMR